MIEQLLLIAVIQGITEFLPVSSSGHLNLLHGLTDFPDQGLAIARLRQVSLDHAHVAEPGKLLESQHPVKPRGAARSGP